MPLRRHLVFSPTAETFELLEELTAIKPGASQTVPCLVVRVVIIDVVVEK
jgi:hypothetical protein